MAQLNDASYKQLFSNPELVRDLVIGFIPYPWLHGLDFSTLERIPCTYVTDDLRQRANDVVWRLKADSEWVYLYLMLEFQARVDPYMAVRMSAYVNLLYQDLIRSANVLPDRRLPPVLPIVFYNGARPWHAVTELGSLMPRMPGELKRFQPRMEYLVVESRHCAEGANPETRNLVAAIAVLQHSNCPVAIRAVTHYLSACLDGNEPLQQTVTNWMKGIMVLRSHGALDLSRVVNLREMEMALHTGFDLLTKEEKEALFGEGKREGVQEGIREGIEEGERRNKASVIKRISTLRFGEFPSRLSARLTTAEQSELDRWIDLVATARTLEEMIAGTPCTTERRPLRSPR